METPAPRDLFLSSVLRCEASERFVHEFYERFMASSPSIRDRFADTVFSVQHPMLLRSLKLCAAATAGDPAGLRELRERAETHSRAHLNIRPALYELWREALIETACQFDELWSQEIENAWNHILGTVVEHMVRHY